jgi:uridylate kinase
MENGVTTILAGGTGNPYFTTDTAAALRAIETGASVLLKGTRVDGIYDSDPEKNPGAIKYDTLSYKEAIDQNLKIMDQTAFTMCRENNMPIIVFNMDKEGNLIRSVSGEKCGTLVKDN